MNNSAFQQLKKIASTTVLFTSTEAGLIPVTHSSGTYHQSNILTITYNKSYYKN